MGIGPLNYGGAGSKKGVHGCGTPMKQIVETSGVATNRYKSMKDRRRKKNLNQKPGKDSYGSSSLNKANKSINKQIDNLGNSYWHSNTETKTELAQLKNTSNG